MLGSIHQPRISRGHRKGSAMILAIITLIISTSICFSMFRTTTLRQQRFINRQWKLQAGLIADAAVDRAYQQLENDADYTGELWKVGTSPGANDPPEDQWKSGEATIQVSKNEVNQFQVTIIAQYPTSSPTRAKTTIETVVTLPQSEPSEELSQLTSEETSTQPLPQTR